MGDKIRLTGKKNAPNRFRALVMCCYLHYWMATLLASLYEISEKARNDLIMVCQPNQALLG
tara:strand:+ start:45760 stop:45942 length:183 start_codon:yes stop_codon:yes gene_type:complete